MELNEYQKLASTTAEYPKTVKDLNPEANVGLLYTVLGLCGEAGELANKVKKVLRDDDGVLSPEKRVALIKELGDCSWYLSETARQLATTLENVAQLNIDKLFDRKDRGVIKGSGDDR